MSQVVRFYDEHAHEEWKRLERYRMEFAITMRAFDDYLPPTPASILDVGGDPGRYAIALAKRHYDVTLADISARELDLASIKAREAGVEIANMVHVNGTDLANFADESFDAVLLMGPLYHLLLEREREQMVRESWRVLRPGGIICASFITRYGLIRDVIRNRPASITENGQFYEHVLATGHLTGPGVIGAFTEAYLVSPVEVRPFMENGGFRTLDLVACEGVTSQIDHALIDLRGDAWDAWVELIYRMSKDPSIYGASDHLLYVGEKISPIRNRILNQCVDRRGRSSGEDVSGDVVTTPSVRPGDGLSADSGTD